MAAGKVVAVMTDLETTVETLVMSYGLGPVIRQIKIYCLEQSRAANPDSEGAREWRDWFTGLSFCVEIVQILQEK
jgi:hypothetical protein